MYGTSGFIICGLDVCEGQVNKVQWGGRYFVQVFFIFLSFQYTMFHDRNVIQEMHNLRITMHRAAISVVQRA